MSNPKGLTPYDARSPLEELSGISKEKSLERLAHAILAAGSGGPLAGVAKALRVAKAASGEPDDEAPPIERYWDVTKAKTAPPVAVYDGSGNLLGMVAERDLSSEPKTGTVARFNSQGQCIGYASDAKVTAVRQGTPRGSASRAASTSGRGPNAEANHQAVVSANAASKEPPLARSAAQGYTTLPGQVAKALLAQRQLAQRQKAFQRGLEREVDGLVRKQQAGVPVLFLTLGQDRVVRKRLAGGRLTPLEERSLLLLLRQTKPAPLPRVKRSR